MTAFEGVVTEMVQDWVSLSSTIALHHFWSLRLEIGNVAWVPLALEGCSPELTHRRIGQLDILLTTQGNKAKYHKVGAGKNCFWKRMKEAHPLRGGSKG